MLIPHDKLQPETLLRLVEEFVTRDGTDYGEQDATIETKVADVMRALRRGQVVVVFDEEAQSANLLDRVTYDQFQGSVAGKSPRQ